MVARSPEDLCAMIRRGLAHPGADRAAREAFVEEFFGGTLDGQAGRRVAEHLLRLAHEAREAR